MRRLTVPLAIAAVVLFGGTVLVWDVLCRARAALERHQREVDDDTAQPRTRGPWFDPPLPGDAGETYRAALEVIHTTPTLERLLGLSASELDPDKLEAALQPVLERLAIAFRQSGAPPAEPGVYRVTAQALQLNLLWLGDRRARDGRAREALELMLVALALAGDFPAACVEDDPYNPQLSAAIVGQEALAGGTLTAAEVESIVARLDRLPVPSMAEVVGRSRLYWKRRCLKELLPKDDFSRFSSWRDFGSTTLREVRLLGELDDVHRAQAERARLPLAERAVAVPHRSPKDCAALAQFWSTYFCCIANLGFEREAQALEARAQLRAALARAAKK